MYSCSEKAPKAQTQIESDNKNENVKEVNLKSELIHCDSILWGANFIAQIDNYLIMQSVRSDPFFWIYEIQNNKIIEKGSFLSFGEGPFEANIPYSFYDNKMNKLFICNFSGILQSMYSIDLQHIDNLYNTSKWKTIKVPDTKTFYVGTSMLALNDSTLLTLGSPFSSQNLYSVIKMSDSNPTIAELDYLCPQTDGTFNIDPVVKQGVYMDATITKHPYLDKFVYACGSGKYADIIEYSGNNLSKKKSLFNIYPKYSTKDGLNRHYDEDCLRGLQTRVTKDAIYLLPLPLTKGDLRKPILYKNYPNYCNDEIFVFNWDGYLIKKYILDTPIYSFLVDDVHNYLFGMSVDLEGDNLIMKRFKLD